jgi:hypothetical protein
VGVCVPIEVLRKLVNKAVGGDTIADDYDLHVGVVAECAVRNRISEAVQNELERRFAPVLRRFASVKTPEALAGVWAEAVESGDVAAAFWATVTHARCNAALREAVCREVHMIQHQAGAAVRADLKRVQSLIDENAVLSRELGRVQTRSTQWQSERIAEHERLTSQLMRTRGESMAKDTVIEMQRVEIGALQSALPDLQSRSQLTRRNEDLLNRLRGLEAKLSDIKRENLGLRDDALAAASRLALSSRTTEEAPPPAPAADHLQARSILCVGGRSGHIPIYRDWVERHGGRFAHHDGGVEDNPHRLDASLAAADLVICQTGCLSHNAYWLVKDHCKRTGKRCVYVDKPSVAGFVKGLSQIQPLPSNDTNSKRIPAEQP